MFIYYEHIADTFSVPPNPEEDLWIFCLSSNGMTTKINFNTERAVHTIVTQIFQTISLQYRSYDATTYVTTIIGTQGKRVLTTLQSLITQRILKGCLVMEMKDIEDKINKGLPLNWVEPPPRTQATRDAAGKKKVEVKFNEEDFFHAPVSQSTELSGVELQKALCSALQIDLPRLAILAPVDLKSLYRRRAMALHPDRNNGDGTAMSELNYLWRLYNAT